MAIILFSNQYHEHFSCLYTPAIFETLICSALVTNQPVSSPDHTPNNLPVNIPMCSHANPSTVIKSTFSPPCLTDAIAVCASVLDPSSNRQDISDDSTIVTSTDAVLLPEQCATVSRHYAYIRQPMLILCQRLTSSHDNILIACHLHLKFIPPSSIPR